MSELDNNIIGHFILKGGPKKPNPFKNSFFQWKIAHLHLLKARKALKSLSIQLFNGYLWWMNSSINLWLNKDIFLNRLVFCVTPFINLCRFYKDMAQFLYCRFPWCVTSLHMTWVERQFQYNVYSVCRQTSTKGFHFVCTAHTIYVHELIIIKKNQYV